MDVNVRVAVRCRPMNAKELARNCTDVVSILPNSVTIKPPPDARENTEDKMFTFDYAYGGDSTQIQVYQDLGMPIITQALDGFNGTIFAYGQTGSGKTFSMMGSETNKGIIPLLNDELWLKLFEKREKMNEQHNNDIDSPSTTDESVDSSSKKPTVPPKTKMQFLVTVSYLEVYNEDIKDLLNPSDKKLKIHESPELGIYVEGLCELVVKDANDVIRLIYQGNAARHVGATLMNDQSSRSHSVFTIKIEQKSVTSINKSLEREQMIRAKVNLVDLAGSERVSKTNATGQTLKEGANINKSLLTLGNVINSLSEGVNTAPGKAKKVIPYRESKLTRLLQESLGGNAQTIMIASISPADYNYLETISTLKYANRAKSIANAVVRNEDSSERTIRDLQQQIETLKAQLLASSTTATTLVDAAAVEKNNAMNAELEAKLKEMELSQLNAWEEKQRLSQQLELERQQNVNTVISQMMEDVKSQKVAHLKNIKRLTNEKQILLKNVKDYKDDNTVLKGSLDSNIQQYQSLQGKLDSIQEELVIDASAMNDPVVLEQKKVKQREAEAIANEMIPLLTKIDTDKSMYLSKKDEIQKIKIRLQKIEQEMTEERGELAASSSILHQNDKIREQIQEEETKKMEAQLAEELSKIQTKFETEKQQYQEDISLSLKNEMEQLRSEIKMLKNILKMEEHKNLEQNERNESLQQYTEQLESRLADTEVAQESAQEDIVTLKKALLEKNEKMKILIEENQKKAMEIENLKIAMLESQAKAQKVQKENLEAEKYQLFKTLMDSFQEDRKLLESKFKQTQQLLAQATKDIMHLATRNQELENQLSAAIYSEPQIL